MSLDINCLQIASDVNACSTDAIAMGNFKEVGVLIPYSEINKNSIVYNGCSVNFDLVAHGGAIKVYDRSFTPFDGTSTTEENKTRFKEYTDLVVFPLFNRDAENAYMLSLFANTKERWVFLLENEKVNATGSNRFIVKGLTAGLTLKTEGVDIQNQAAYKIELQQINSVYPELFYFDTDDLTTMAKVDEMLSFDLIYGGTITAGGSVKLTIDTDKTGYIKLPDGSILTTVAGVIDTTYTGVGGAITYFVPKNNSIFYIVSSGIIGDITYNGIGSSQIDDNFFIESIKYPFANDIVAFGNLNNKYIYAPNTITINAGLSALTAKSIGDILYAAYVDSRLNVNFNFSGGTNATANEIDTYLINTGLFPDGFDTLVGELETLGGDITYNS